MSRLSCIMGNPRTLSKLEKIYEDTPVLTLEIRFFLSSWFEDDDWQRYSQYDQDIKFLSENLMSDLLSRMQHKLSELTAEDFYLIRVRMELMMNDLKAMSSNCAPDFIKEVKNLMQKEESLYQQLLCDPEKVDDQEVAMDQYGEPDSKRKQVDDDIMCKLNDLGRKVQSFYVRIHDMADDVKGTDERYREMIQKQEHFINEYEDNENVSRRIELLQQQMHVLKMQLSHQKQSSSKQAAASAVRVMEVRQRQDVMEHKRREAELTRIAESIHSLRVELTGMYQIIIQELQLLQSRVLDEQLIDWKRHQQLCGNGALPDSHRLDLLQKWCEHLAELTWTTRMHIKRMSMPNSLLLMETDMGVADLLPVLNDTITGLLSSLVTSSFIVEKQPPQVLKKECRFSSSVRLLVGRQLNIQMDAPQVKASIISEQQAKGWLGGDAGAPNLTSGDAGAPDMTSGEILNNTGTMDFLQTPGAPVTGHLSVRFGNMQLKQIRRSDRRVVEAVTDEKFCILFQSEFNVGGYDLVFQVWTLSLPLVVTVHGNQECNAMATVFWDNAFSEPGRVPFIVPQSAVWSQLGEQLNTKFRQMTGEGLSCHSQDYLASKILGLPTPVVDFGDRMVTWSQFNKEPLKERSFTFWEWFYAIMKTTREHLKAPWVDGLIVGFISKTEAQECLFTKENGTFLLRFSDSECGGVTIAWIAESSNSSTNEREVWNLAPYVARDFSIRGLADRIRDLTNLTFLFPNVPKDAAFGKYCTVPQEQENSNRNGYVPNYLVNVIGGQQQTSLTTWHQSATDDPRCRFPFSNSTPSPPYPATPSAEDGMEQMMEYLTALDYECDDVPPVLNADDFCVKDM